MQLHHVGSPSLADLRSRHDHNPLTTGDESFRLQAAFCLADSIVRLGDWRERVRDHAPVKPHAPLDWLKRCKRDERSGWPLLGQQASSRSGLAEAHDGAGLDD